MTLIERDAFVVARMVALVAQGMTQRQAACELVRTVGAANLAMPELGRDAESLVTDVAGMHTAVTDLASPAARAAATAAVARGVVASLHKNKDNDSYRGRVVAAGG